MAQKTNSQPEIQLQPKTQRKKTKAKVDKVDSREVVVSPVQEEGEEELESDDKILSLVDAPAFPGEDSFSIDFVEDSGKKASPIFPAGESITKFDPLTLYMQEIRKYPLLSREEEHTLAIKFSKTRDARLARQLISSNLRLVVKIAHEYRRAYRNLLDLIQEGNLGLLQAVEKYDPHRGVKLSSYAAWWIRAYMLKFILNNWRLVKIGTTQAQRKLFFNLSKEKEMLEASGVVPSNDLLATRLAVSEKEVADMQLRLGSGELSLDAPLSKDEGSGGRTQGDLLEASAESRPDVQLEGQEFRTLLQQKLEIFEKTLKGREQTLFRERLIAENPLTLQEVGEQYNISRERARQIEARLLSRLKVYLKRELGEAVQIAMGLEG